MDSVLKRNVSCMRRMNRIVIYPQDVALITGRSDRYGRMIIKRIKEALRKEDHHLVTIKEFSEYTGIDISLIEAVIYG